MTTQPTLPGLLRFPRADREQASVPRPPDWRERRLASQQETRANHE